MRERPNDCLGSKPIVTVELNDLGGLADWQKGACICGKYCIATGPLQVQYDTDTEKYSVIDGTGACPATSGPFKVSDWKQGACKEPEEPSVSMQTKVVVKTKTNGFKLTATKVGGLQEYEYVGDLPK